MKLLDYIPTGRENAIPARELAIVAGFKDARTLQQEIARLRKRGELILSAPDHPHGYFLPANDYEISRFVHSMHNRISETQAAVRAAEQHLTERG